MRERDTDRSSVTRRTGCDESDEVAKSRLDRREVFTKEVVRTLDNGRLMGASSASTALRVELLKVVPLTPFPMVLPEFAWAKPSAGAAAK